MDFLQRVWGLLKQMKQTCSDFINRGKDRLNSPMGTSKEESRCLKRGIRS